MPPCVYCGGKGSRVNILGVDTSTAHAAVALGGIDGAVTVAVSDPTQQHGRGLLPAVRDLLRRAGLRISDLGGFAVGLGPGSYTGLRVGITAIKTLAYATGRPVVGIESFDIVARNAPGAVMRVAVIGDAQRGDLYIAEFKRDSANRALQRLGPTRVESAVAWLEKLDPSTLVIGPAAERAGAVPEVARPADASWNRPDGIQLIALARAELERGRSDEPRLLEPLYLRRSAAEDLWDRKGTS
jgi:tRNA threonylcarbamoyladenosine biosynthesis protein TsaB